jgi:hypothetical protein
MKPAMVTLRPQPGAAVTMDLQFTPASNITIDGVTLNEVQIGNHATKNIVVRNADIPGQVIFDTGELANSNILFDHNVHRDFSKCDRCAEGRVALMENNDQNVGITIQNSEFRGGMSDGIANGANGLKILNNTFHDLIPGTPDGVHTDAIQLYGSKNTLIKGNFIYDVQGHPIMSPDGADHEIIEDNVIAADPGGYPFAIMLGSDNGSIIRHNTFPDGSCAWNLRCGIIQLSAKSANPTGTGTIVKDNVLGGAISMEDGSTAQEISHNLVAAATSAVNGNLRGVARFRAGSRPSTWAGYALAADSLGKGTASDGGDRGIRLGAVEQAPPVASKPTANPAVKVRLLTRLRTLVKSGRLRLEVSAQVPTRIVLTARLRPGRALNGRARNHARRTISLERKSMSLRSAGKRRVSFKVGRTMRRTLARSRNAALSVRLYADSARKQQLGTFKLTVRR